MCGHVPFPFIFLFFILLFCFVVRLRSETVLQTLLAYRSPVWQMRENGGCCILGFPFIFRWRLSEGTVMLKSRFQLSHAQRAAPETVNDNIDSE